VYLGVIGRQDGVDMFIRMAAKISQVRPDVSYVVVGDGEELPALRRLADELGLGEQVRFTGWLPGPLVQAELDAATVAVQPDPRNAMNELSTMAKTVEYLAHGLPVVAVDLTETRASAGDAAVYVHESDPDLLADAVIGLLDDPQRAALLGSRGRQRVAGSLAWDHQIAAYVGLYARWLPLQARQGRSTNPRDEDDETSAADTVRLGGFLHGQPPRAADGNAVPTGPEHR
jgi:glycosyltransferase involved in cell wall biosynthesis